jgi:ankyrin
VKTGNFDKIDLLLEARADPCRASETGAYPLQLAVNHDRLSLARQLLQARANASQCDTKQVQPLHLATHKRNPRMMQLLLMHKANPNAAERLGQTPIFFAARQDAIDVLLEAQADPLHLNKKGQSALHLAARCGHFEAVAFMTEHESMASFIDMQDELGRTPLHHAAISGYQDVVSRLMDVGADPRIKTNKGATAMSLADGAKHMDVAYYIYTRVTGSNRSTWSESCHNPVFLTMAAIMGVACFVNRALLWEFSWDLVDLTLRR